MTREGLGSAAGGRISADLLAGLDPPARALAELLAGLRLPAEDETLAELLAAGGLPPHGDAAPERSFARAMAQLTDRGLLARRQGAPRALAPEVREALWSGLPEAELRRLAELRRDFFTARAESAPERAAHLRELAPVVELFAALADLDRGDEAFALFKDRLGLPLIFPLTAFDLRASLLGELAPDGAAGALRVSAPEDVALLLQELGRSHLYAGRPGQAALPLERSVAVEGAPPNPMREALALGYLTKALRLAGRLKDSHAAGRRSVERAVQVADRPTLEAYVLHLFGLTQAACGRSEEAGESLQRSLSIFTAGAGPQEQGVIHACLAQNALWAGDARAARTAAEAAWQAAEHDAVGADFVRAARLQGAAALALGEVDRAHDLLTDALERARETAFQQEEMAARIGLAELSRQRGDTAAAHRLLDPVWEPAARGPYRLEDADAHAVLARLEAGVGRRQAAVEAARQARELAWCDGPPFAYAAGLAAAREELERLDVRE